MLKNESGQITVFLSMTFIVFLGLAFCCLEGIHGYLESALAEEAFEEAGNEILASYDKYIFNKYYVFFLDPREKKYIKKDAMDFMNNYGSSGTYGFRCLDLMLTEEKTAVEERGLFLRYQISEFMKHYKAAQTQNELRHLVESLKGNADEIRSRQADFDGSGRENMSSQENEADNEDEASEEEVDSRTLSRRLSWSKLRQNLSLAARSGILLYAVDQTDRLSSASVSSGNLPSEAFGDSHYEKLYEKIFSWNSLSEWKDFLGTADFKGIESLDLNRDKKLMDYLFLCFQNYRHTDSKDHTALKYELEYLIGGKKNDRDNLRYVAERILLMRFIVNYRYASHNAGLLDSADEMAESLLGSSDFSDGKAAIRTMLIAALSYGESLLELHALMKGDKVACTKESSNWNLSFDDAASRLGSKASVISRDKGLSYEDYLRVLLYLKSSEKKFIYRIMDIMQLNTALHEPGFKMSDSLCAFTWTGILRCPRWFALLPGLSSGQKEGFEIKLTRYVSY